MIGFGGMRERPAPKSGAERRRCGRLVCTSLKCDFGEVIDLSVGGFRVWSKRPPRVGQGETVQLTLNGVTGTLAIAAKALYCVKGQRRGYETGFSFVGPSPELQAAVRELALRSTPQENAIGG